LSTTAVLNGVRPDAGTNDGTAGSRRRASATPSSAREEAAWPTRATNAKSNLDALGFIVQTLCSPSSSGYGSAATERPEFSARRYSCFERLCPAAAFSSVIREAVVLVMGRCRANLLGESGSRHGTEYCLEGMRDEGNRDFRFWSCLYRVRSSRISTNAARSGPNEHTFRIGQNPAVELAGSRNVGGCAEPVYEIDVPDTD
jgi:hypothetical protein